MTETFDNTLIEDTTVKLLKFAATQLPNDVSEALKKMYEAETKPTSKAAFSSNTAIRIATGLLFIKGIR